MFIFYFYSQVFVKFNILQNKYLAPYELTHNQIKLSLESFLV
jgi:hypothetical protein